MTADTQRGTMDHGSAVAEMTRGEYLDLAAAPAGGREMAGAELDVYCPEHGGYRGRDCRCARPGPGQAVRVDARFAAFTLGTTTLTTREDRDD